MLNSISIFSSTIFDRNVDTNNKKKVLNNKTLPNEYIIGIVFVIILFLFYLFQGLPLKKKKNKSPKKTTETEGDVKFTEEEIQQYKSWVPLTEEELKKYKKPEAEEINKVTVNRYTDKKNSQVKYLKLDTTILEFIYDDQNKVKKIYIFSEGGSYMVKFYNSVEYSLAEKYLIYNNISFILEQNNQIYMYNKNNSSKVKYYKKNDSYFTKKNGEKEEQVLYTEVKAIKDEYEKIKNNSKKEEEYEDKNQVVSQGKQKFELEYNFTEEEIKQFESVEPPTKEELQQYEKLEAGQFNDYKIYHFIDKNKQVKYLILGLDIYEFIYDDQDKVTKIYDFSKRCMIKFDNSVEYSLAEKSLIYDNPLFILEQNNQIHRYNKDDNSKEKIYKKKDSYFTKHGEAKEEEIDEQEVKRLKGQYEKIKNMEEEEEEYKYNENRQIVSFKQGNKKFVFHYHHNTNKVKNIYHIDTNIKKITKKTSFLKNNVTYDSAKKYIADNNNESKDNVLEVIYCYDEFDKRQIKYLKKGEETFKFEYKDKFEDGEDTDCNIKSIYRVDNNFEHVKTEASFYPSILEDTAVMYIKADDNFKLKIIRSILNNTTTRYYQAEFGYVEDKKKKKAYSKLINKEYNSQNIENKYTVFDIVESTVTKDKGKKVKKEDWGQPKTVGEDYFEPKEE